MFYFLEKGDLQMFDCILILLSLVLVPLFIIGFALLLGLAMTGGHDGGP